jgi:hypothetical protein
MWGDNWPAEIETGAVVFLLWKTIIVNTQNGQGSVRPAFCSTSVVHSYHYRHYSFLPPFGHLYSDEKLIAHPNKSLYPHHIIFV